MTLTPDVRVRVEATGLNACPDGALGCGPLSRSEVNGMAVTSAANLVEVTSPSTGALRAVLLASHAGPRVTLVERIDGAWRTADVRMGEGVRVASRALERALDALHAVLAAS